MTIPEDTKDRAIYHTMLADMHRLQGTILNLRAITAGDTEPKLRDHFTREQNILLGKLVEWKQRRPQIYAQAQADFTTQVRPEG